MAQTTPFPAYLPSWMKAPFEQAAAAIEPIDPADFDQLQCDWYNAIEGHLTGYDCKACKNRGYIAVLEDGYQLHKECACMKIRRNRKNMHQSGLSDALDRMTFDSYRCTEPWQERARDAAMHYVDKQDGRWLYLAGQSGTGKTHLCTAVCGALLQRGVSVRYEMWRSLCREMQRFETRDQKLAEMAACDVLYIDDFLKNAAIQTVPNEPYRQTRLDGELRKEINLAFEIINERYIRKKPLILSSEVLLRPLFQLDGAIAGRIRERCGGFVIQIRHGEARNYRMQ